MVYLEFKKMVHLTVEIYTKVFVLFQAVEGSLTMSFITECLNF